MIKNQKIVIAGAGFAGVRVALMLNNIASENQVLLINDNPYHTYQPDLYQLASSALPKEGKKEFVELDSTVNIPLKQILSGRKIELLIDQIKSVDLTKNLLVARKEGEINYDFLILCLGSAANYFNIPGASEFSHPLKTGADALNIRNDIEELVSHSEGAINIAIAGGGFTGVELAGSLVKFMKKLDNEYKKPLSKLTIIEGGEDVLLDMPVWAQKVALGRLRRLGVEVLLKHQINRVDKDKIHCQEGEIFSFDYLIWTAGVRGENLTGQIKGVEFNQKDQIQVIKDLSLDKYPNVFVVGDLSSLAPQAAWAALGEADIAASNIQRKLKGEGTQKYLPQEPIFIVPIGGLFAISNLWIFHLSGVVGWALKRLVSLKYFLSILPFFQAISLWMHGAKFYIPTDLEE